MVFTAFRRKSNNKQDTPNPSRTDLGYIFHFLLLTFPRRYFSLHLFQTNFSFQGLLCTLTYLEHSSSLWCLANPFASQSGSSTSSPTILSAKDLSLVNSQGPSPFCYLHICALSVHAQLVWEPVCLGFKRLKGGYNLIDILVMAPLSMSGTDSASETIGCCYIVLTWHIVSGWVNSEKISPVPLVDAEMLPMCHTQGDPCACLHGMVSQ